MEARSSILLAPTISPATTIAGDAIDELTGNAALCGIVIEAVRAAVAAP